MDHEPLNPKSTLAILLGGSDYPKHEDLDPLVQAANAAHDFEEYLLSQTGLHLPAANILALFDTDDSPNDVDTRISHFLKGRKPAMRDTGDATFDLIFYYVGHGGFTVRDQDYFLALRTTTKNREGTSSYRMTDLANTLANDAKSARKYLIFDCCFAASAYEFFQQSDVNEKVRQQIRQNLPKKGTSLLCASSSSKVSLTPKNGDYPMFSGMLLKILKTGDPQKKPAYSLYELGNEILEQLIKEYPDSAVRPKVISPDERDGDIADIPIFPNASLKVDPLEGRITAAERGIQTIVQEFGLLKQSISEDFDSKNQSLRSELDRVASMLEHTRIEIARIQESLIQNVTTAPSASQASQAGEQEETQLQRVRRLTATMPQDVRRWYKTAHDGWQFGLAWLLISVAVAFANGLVAYRYVPRAAISIVVVTATLLLTIASIIGWVRGDAFYFELPDGSENSEWSQLGSVQRLIGSRGRDVLGIPVQEPFLQFGVLIVFLTCICNAVAFAVRSLKI